MAGRQFRTPFVSRPTLQGPIDGWPVPQQQLGGARVIPDRVPATYPGAMPPPVGYPTSPRRRRLARDRRWVVRGRGRRCWALDGRPRTRPGGDAVTVTTTSATTAIQGFLEALPRATPTRWHETIRAGCSMRSRTAGRTDAGRLTSDAFRAQYARPRYRPIDKIVLWSPLQAQVLFTMRVTGRRSQGEVERQGVAQLLVEQDILVCSHLPRNCWSVLAGQC